MRPGEHCGSLYLVMSGVVAVYIKQQYNEDILTDYLGIGSFFGQYSMFEKSAMSFGFRCVSNEGALIIRLQIESIEKIAPYNQ